MTALSKNWPTELPEGLIQLLGRPPVVWEYFARYYRQAGHNVPDEVVINGQAYSFAQAFFLHRMIGLWFEHGDNWVQAADLDLDEVKRQIIAQEKADREED